MAFESLFDLYIINIDVPTCIQVGIIIEIHKGALLVCTVSQDLEAFLTGLVFSR